MDAIPVGVDEVMPSVDALTSVAHSIDAALTTTSGGYFEEFDSHAFYTSLTMIVISELGDKTFLVAALMAMKHDRWVVFTGAFVALALMSVLSALLGHTMPALLPRWVTQTLACGLFVVFGVKMLLEAREMDADASVQEEMREVEHEIEAAEDKTARMAEEGDVPHRHDNGNGNGGNTSRKRPSFATGSAPLSPDVRIERDYEFKTTPTTSISSTLRDKLESSLNLFSLVLSPVFVQTFTLTFLGEWGDRSQIATIAMAAGSDYGWVIVGTVLGHCACTALAVVGGRLLASKISVRTVTLCGGVLFLVFGGIYGLELAGYEFLS